jgi:Fic family protein
MVSIVTKRIKGNDYIYLVTSIRNGGRVQQKVVKYIGKRRPILKEEFVCMKLSAAKKDWVLNCYSDYLSYQDHAKMKELSDAYRCYLHNLDSVSRGKKRERFLSAFIAHSNAIEGSTLTQKETFNYLFKDCSPQGHSKKELNMAENLLHAWEYVEKNSNRMPTHQDLFALHRFVNYGIESEETLGKYKKVQNYIGDVHTTSYLFVEDRMGALFRWIKKAHKKMNDAEVAFQSHAQFEIIHPFVDGNGRVGRLLMNWLLLYKGLMPLAVPVSTRSNYIAALENSRKGKVEAISRFCFKVYSNQYETF